MQLTENKVQEMIHRVEMGPFKVLILRAAFLLTVAGVAALYLFLNFRGLDSETAMDQAQVGRQIAAGTGYSTLYIRPMAMWQFMEKGGLPTGFFPDTYNAPLNPAINAVLLRPIKRWWPMEPTDIVYMADRVIAAGGLIMFLASVVLVFFLTREIFDSRIAWLTTALVLLTDMMWRFSVSGLPQNTVLFLFILSLFFLHRAMQSREDGRTGAMLLQLAAVAFLLGVATLGHPAVAWMFLGFLVFTAIWFRPRSVSTLLVFFVFLLVVGPWLVRNYMVSGNPLGLGIFAILDGTTGSESSFMRSLQPDMTAFGAVRAKLRGGFTGQFENLFTYLGFNVAAAAFFFAFLHIFRHSVTNMFRWCVVLMWVGAATGMALFAPQGAVSANQLHMLFVPIFAAYGMAFLLVLWNRLEIRFAPARNAFIGAVCAVTALPMAVNLLTAPSQRVNWPPYVPPFINAVCQWMKPGEIICSDMPWATAWYGGRVSLLIPSTVEQFVQLNDYKTLGGPINGLYLTPVSGNRPYLTQIARGEYEAWENYILGRAELDPNYSAFPLKAKAVLPIDGQCLFYSDTDRWNTREEL
ncbi:MAG: glycosyltransferase family 39 protein [Chthoniobacterales bacterium]